MGEKSEQETEDSGVDRSGRARHRMRRLGAARRPNSRSVLGGALVATAAIGVLLSQRAATAAPTTAYVVAVRQVPAGASLSAADLGTITAQLPDDATVFSKADAEELLGRTTRVPLQPMDLVRTGDVFDRGRFGPGAANEVVLDLPPAAAMHGALDTGDRVTVLSTDPDSTGTTTVATDVLVTSVHGDDEDAIGVDGGVRVRVGVPDLPTAEAIVDAAIRSEVTLVLPAPGTAIEAEVER